MTVKWRYGLIPPHFHGSFWHDWAICYLRGRRYLVLHFPTKTRLTEFRGGVSSARRFCEAIDPLVDDWSAALTASPVDPQLDVIMHREACRAAGVELPPPKLRVIP